MKLKIEFDTDSAAFNPCEGDRDTSSDKYEVFYPSLDEVDSVLAVVFKQLESGKTSAPIRDTNGNTIGQWSWK